MRRYSLLTALAIAVAFLVGLPVDTATAAIVLDPEPLTVRTSVLREMVYGHPDWEPIKTGANPNAVIGASAQAQAAKLRSTTKVYAASPLQVAAARKKAIALGGKTLATSGMTVAQWRAANESAKATLSGSEKTALATVKTKFRIPATPVKKVAKGVGAAANVLFSYDLGTMIGNGIVSILGVNTDGACAASAAQGGWIELVAGTDCSQYGVVDEYVPNGDASALAPGYKDNRLTFGTGPYVVGGNTYPFYALGNGDPVVVVGQRVTVKVVKQYAVGNQSLGNSDLRLWCQGPSTGVVGAPMTLVAPSTWKATGGDLSASWTATCEGIGRQPLAITKGSVAAYNASSNFQWYGAAAPEYATNSNEPNPLRHWRCEVKELAPEGGGTGAVLSDVSASFRETDESWPQVKCPTLPPELILGNVTIWQVNEATGVETQVQSTDTADSYRTTGTENPECLDGSCILDLQFKSGTKWKTCFDSPEECTGWWEHRTDTDQFRCLYGTEVVDYRECAAYKVTFEDTTSVETVYCIPVDADGNTCYSTDDTTTDTETGTGGECTVGCGSNESSECFPTGWAVFNPVGWVLQPVQCALRAAFIPSSTGVQQLEAKRDEVLGNTAFGSVATAVGTMASTFNIAASGCKGPPFRYVAFGVDETYYPMDACDEPMRGVAGAVNGMLAFSIVTVTILSGLRYLAGTIGFIGWSNTGDLHPGSGSGGGGVKFK